MHSQPISQPPRYSPITPSLSEALEAFEKAKKLLAVLPAPLRIQIEREIQVYIAAGLPFSSWFHPPSRLVINENHFQFLDGSEISEFYKAVADYLSQSLQDHSDFDTEQFGIYFANTALIRYRENSAYIPPVNIPSPMIFFLSSIWSVGDSTTLSNLWQQSRQAAAARDRFKILRNGGQLLRSPAADFFGSLALETIRVFKEYEWEISGALQGESDPATLRNKTTFRLQGIWKKFELGGEEANGDVWVIHPRAAMEARVASPAIESDLLFLGGFELLVANTKDLTLDIAPQAGFSTKKLAFFGQAIPGAEMAFNLTRRLQQNEWFKFWQASAVIQYGFAHQEEPNTTILGLVFKWTL